MYLLPVEKFLCPNKKRSGFNKLLSLEWEEWWFVF